MRLQNSQEVELRWQLSEPGRVQLGLHHDPNHPLKMLPKILESNFPLSGDSRARLLKLRASQLLELEIINKSIDVDRASIMENKSAITRIERAIKQSKAALVMHDSNTNALKASEIRLRQFSQAHVEGDTSAGEDTLITCRRASDLISSRVSSELQYVEQQQKSLHFHIVDLSSMLSSLERELHDRNVGLVLSESSLSVHTTIMEGGLSTLEIVKAVISPVKHVPSEVWAEIFRIIDAEVGGKRARILPVSKVCREWRAIFLGCRWLWKRAVISPVPWWPQLKVDGFSWLLTRANGGRISLVIHLHSAQKWESQALASELLGSLYLHKEHVYYEEEPTVSPGKKKYSGWGMPPRVQKFKPTYQQGYSGTERQDLVTIPPSLLPQQYSVHFYLGPESDQVEQRPLSIPFNTPHSITIEAPTPRQGSFSNILSSFNKVSRFTLLNVSPETPNQVIGKLQEAKYLRFSTSRMLPFDISPLLSRSLEELHVEHSCDNTFPQLASIIELPKLHTLAITLHEHYLCSMLEFSTLRTLILHSSAPARDLVSTLDFFKSKRHFRRITHLRFCDWDGMGSSSTVIEIVKNIAAASMHLTELTFTNCRLEIPNLISMVASNVYSLKVINLVCCVGITRADCESLRLNVERLTISV